ncbi:hypothetical protein D3C81_1152490 [compost metagenome]
MRGKDDCPALHLAQNIQAIRAIQRNNPFILERIRDMAVVHNHAEYIYRPRQIEVLSRLPGQNHRVHDTVAVTARRNFNHFHESYPCFLVPQFSLTEGSLSIINYSGRALKIAGSQMMKVVPSPRLVNTSTDPSCSSIIHLAIDNPSPVP